MRGQLPIAVAGNSGKIILKSKGGRLAAFAVFALEILKQSEGR